MMQRELVIKEMFVNIYSVYSIPYLERSLHPHTRLTAAYVICKKGVCNYNYISCDFFLLFFIFIQN